MTDHSDLIAELQRWASFESERSAAVLNRAADAISSQSLSLSEAREETERLKDFGGDAVDLAGRILENLGIGQDASREPGADRRRDRIAAMIQRSIDAASPDLSSLRKGAEVAPGDLQLLDRLKRDNTYDGARLVVSGEEELAQAWRLSEDGLIALEQVARGVRLHITRKGVAALAAALVSGSREDGE